MREGKCQKVKRVGWFQKITSDCVVPRSQVIEHDNDIY